MSNEQILKEIEVRHNLRVARESYEKQTEIMKCAALVLATPGLSDDKIQLAMNVIKSWRNSTAQIHDMLPEIRAKWWGHGMQLELEIERLNEALPKAYQRKI